MRKTSTAAAAVCLTALVAATSSDAQTADPDPARRGLDVFLHAPDVAAPGRSLPLQIEAVGFPTVVSLVPLGGATVEAAWDPESLGPGLHAAPPAVRVTTDAAGRAHLSIPVPDGAPGALKLLLGVRSGGHARTRSFSIQRGPAEQLALHVADRRVVPGSAVSAWVTLTSAATGAPAGGQRVELRLLEGGFARHKVTLVTDAAGTAMTRIPIPQTDEATWSWQLEARTVARGDSGEAEATQTLTPREETPGAPRLAVRWQRAAALAGDRVAFTATVRDAADRPIAGLPIRYWIGPKGTEPPREEGAFAAVSTRAVTSATGEIEGAAAAPSTVVAGVGTTLRIVARASVEGHDLEQADTVAIGAPVASATLLPEAGALVPGLEQRVLLRVRDGRDKPVAARFAVEGDGLSASVTTDADGEAEVTFRPPVDVGALRNVGPCAGGVAAAVLVRPLEHVPALAPRSEPFQLCVPVDRDATALVRAERPIAKVGERVRVRVLEAEGAKGRGKRPWSVVLRSENGAQAASVWLDDGGAGGEIEVPPAAGGAWSLSAASPGGGRVGPRAPGGSPERPARVASGALLVTPALLPRLGARLAGGRATPGGAVDIDAELSDGHGRGLPGAVAAVVVDARGGGSTGGIEALDTRRAICARFGVEGARCDRFVEGDAALDPLRRGELGAAGVRPLAPASDPAAEAEEALSRAFGEVLRSLEGAVFEATQSADQLRDVRRRGPGGFTFNPELMTLVTAAMDRPPLTPGGEPLALADLIAVDPQVTFDNVARRITRLKLFRVLAAVREFRRERGLDLDEPALKAPNALLRRMVRDGKLGEDLLLDPWGGTIQFAPSSGPPVPFLSVVRGFELRAPGPDGALGTGDDVRDPFERVLRSGTPYARALREDALVDARYDLEVGDATVSAWQSLFDELTGTALGNASGGEGLGLGGIGTGGGGHGSGVGYGHGRVRSSVSITSGVAYWSVPQRTDGSGRVRIHIPLGDAETTWRVALVGVPDGGQPATAGVDVPVALPLSARVDAGASWVEGDQVSVAVTLRNRTDRPIRAAVDAAPFGVAALSDKREAAQTLEVPSGGAAVARVSLRAPAPGQAGLAVTVRAPGLPDDTLRHTWQVLGAGEPTDLTRSQWVAEGTPADLAVALDPRSTLLLGRPRLVLERGAGEALRGALDALDPDRLRSPGALADAIEVAARIERWAVEQGGDGSALAGRAAEIARRALGRLNVYRAEGALPWPAARRADAFAPLRERAAAKAKARPAGEKPTDACPSDAPAPLDERLDGLDAEPSPAGGASLACWDAFVSNVVDEVQRSSDARSLARAALALAERPHRAATAAALLDRLRAQVSLRASGGISLPPELARLRAARATVFAALLRGHRLGRPGAAPADRLAAWIAVQRDVDGGYGSSLATRSVVRALIASPGDSAGASVATVSAGGAARDVTLAPSTRVVLPLDAPVTAVKVAVRGPGIIARFERPALRRWSGPPSAGDSAAVGSPVHVDVTWPSDARAGRTGVLRVLARHDLGRTAPLDLRLPLPPGVALAEPVNGVRQAQGALSVRRSVDGGERPTIIEIPLRFSLAGKVTVPEARATIAREELPRALVPARPLVIR